jgi:hypothetical protein
LADGARMARGLRVGRYCFAAGRCSAAIHCPQNADLPAHPRFLEGEGLGNDATALTLYRFAVAAVSVNLFSFGKARDCSPPLLQAKLFGGLALAR